MQQSGSLEVLVVSSERILNIALLCGFPLSVEVVFLKILLLEVGKFAETDFNENKRIFGRLIRVLHQFKQSFNFVLVDTDDLILTEPFKAIGNNVCSLEPLVSDNMIVNKCNWLPFNCIKDFHFIDINVHFEIR